jgi:hypothetical protein
MSAASPRISGPASFSSAWVVGFVGHRTGLDELTLAPLIEHELHALDTLVAAGGGTLHFYSSVADGADLIALDQAEKVGLPSHVLLPVPEEDFFRAFPNDTDRARARSRLSALRAAPHRHTIRLAPTSMRLPEAYFEADARIVAAADFLLVVWDGQPERGRGGTAQIVALARAKSVPLIWIHKETGRVKREGIPDYLPADPVLARLAAKKVLRLSEWYFATSRTDLN